MLKKIIVFILSVAFCVSLFAQAKTKNKTDNTKSAQKETKQTKEAKKEDKKEAAPKTATSALPSGYGDVMWGNDYATVKNKVKGKITFADENKIIVSKDNEITYRYGFFYIDPEILPDMKGAGEPARLFYSTIEFPYVAMEDIRSKITEKYGEPTGDNIKENRGALYWDGDKTSAIMWVDQYEKRGFCRKIIYFDKAIVSELADYKYKLFNKRELDVLKNLIP